MHPFRFPFRAALLSGLAALVAAGAAPAAETPLVRGDTRLAVAGDSITEQRTYTKYIEMYLAACQPARPAMVAQFGWSGETAPGFAARLDKVVLPERPTLLTLCYGMNDGRYRPYEDATGEAYRQALDDIVGRAKAAGATVLVAGPGCVDSQSFRRGNVTPDQYNDTLARLSALARAVAEKHGQPFVDMHAVCADAMARAKAGLGEAFEVMGRDGIHPGAPGHLAMAYAFLRGMGFDGDIGTIDVQWQDGAVRHVEATDGHEAALGADGAVEIASARWPFVFSGPADGQGTRAMMPYLPFNRDLNRFVLKVRGAAAERIEIEWGGARRQFDRAAAEAGINLAEAFAGETPFQRAWGELEKRVDAKQRFETWWLKNIMGELPQHLLLAADAPEVAELRATFRERFGPAFERHAARVREASAPVRHTLKIRPAP